MIHLCRDPDGKTIMEPSSTGVSDVADHTYLTEIASLKQQIAELENKL